MEQTMYDLPKVKYSFGQIVYLLTDPEQNERIVTGYVIRPDGIRYKLSCSEEETEHFDIEIRDYKNFKP